MIHYLIRKTKSNPESVPSIIAIYQRERLPESSRFRSRAWQCSEDPEEHQCNVWFPHCRWQCQRSTPLFLSSISVLPWNWKSGVLDEVFKIEKYTVTTDSCAKFLLLTSHEKTLKCNKSRKGLVPFYITYSGYIGFAEFDLHSCFICYCERRHSFFLAYFKSNNDNKSKYWNNQCRADTW